MQNLSEEKSRHTPGPWAYDADSGEIYFDDGDVCPVIAYVNRDDVSVEQANADGSVLAAAHAMLAALKEAEELLEQTLRWSEGWECSEDELLGSIRAAIAKAEGR